MAIATSIPSATNDFLLSKKKARRARRIDPTPTLFPDVPNQGDSGPDVLLPPGSAPERVGIARLAYSSPLADAKRGTEYFLLPVKSILNHCDSNRVPFSWTVNPYRGCEFGCKYCYARYTHEFMELDGRTLRRRYT
jgi:sulfatase maturation enzyme AslB (radical SAM superfamily)